MLPVADTMAAPVAPSAQAFDDAAGNARYLPVEALGGSAPTTRPSCRSASRPAPTVATRFSTVSSASPAGRRPATAASPSSWSRRATRRPTSAGCSWPTPRPARPPRSTRPRSFAHSSTRTASPRHASRAAWDTAPTGSVAARPSVAASGPRGGTRSPGQRSAPPSRVPCAPCQRRTRTRSSAPSSVTASGTATRSSSSRRTAPATDPRRAARRGDPGGDPPASRPRARYQEDPGPPGRVTTGRDGGPRGDGTPRLDDDGGVEAPAVPRRDRQAGGAGPVDLADPARAPDAGLPGRPDDPGRPRAPSPGEADAVAEAGRQAPLRDSPGPGDAD